MEQKTRAALEAEVVELKEYIDALESKLETIADVVGEAEDQEDEPDEEEIDDEEADEFEDEEDTDDTEDCPSTGRRAA